MRKTLPYLVLLLLLGVGVWYFLYRPEGEAFDPDEAGFTVRDTAAIHTILLARVNGDRVVLERTPQGWVLDGQHPVLPAPMRQLMSTLYGQVASYPVPKKMHNMAVTALAVDGVKVELLDKAGKPIRVFYVGEEVQDFKGTYMLMEGARRPYVVTLSGFEGYLKPRYATTWYDWRDRTVFNVPADQIQQVSVKYEEDQRQSFTIARNAAGVTASLGNGVSAGVNPRRAEMYLGFFENVQSEGFLNGKLGVQESLAATAKKAVIELTKKDGSQQRVDVYWMPVNQRSKNTGDELYDPDRYYAILNGGRDTVIIQEMVFEKIFRDGREFFQADTAQPQQQAQPHIHTHAH